MNRTMTVLCMFVALLMVTSAWADKEVTLLNDVSPTAGPVNYPPVDDPWDMIFYFNAGVVCADNQLLGPHFADGNFYITGAGNAADPNYVYVCDATGAFNFSFTQSAASTGWGWRDLAYDGTYMYGSVTTTVEAFDLAGNLVPAMNINGPSLPNRALAYDPDTDTFWTQSFSGPIYNFDRSGAVLYTGTSGVTAAYGMAFDEYSADGPWLWILDQTGTPQTTIHQYDPIDHVLTGFAYVVPLVPGSTAQVAGGLSMTDQYAPGLACLVGITQGTPDDMLFVLELTIVADPGAPGAPENFAIANNGADLLASLSWDNPTLTVGGDPLTEITDIVISRDGIVIDNLGVSTPGAAMAYDDIVSSAGVYGYSVMCVNSLGDGIPVSGNAAIGLDVPAGVDNLVGAGILTNLEAELNWDNPTTGANGGYFPAGSIDGYTIYRYGPDPATFTVTGLATYYYDNTMTLNGFYEYGVVAYNSTGNGPEVISNTFFVGPPEFEEIAYDWIEINPAEPYAMFPGTNTGIVLDDDNEGPFALGFTFPFYTDQTQIYFCSNGWASFTSTLTSYINYAIPTAATPNDLICPYWDDMNPSLGGSVWYYSDVAGGRFIGEWYNVPHYSTGGNYKFEFILYDDGTIDYMYCDLTPGTALSATVGVEDSFGAMGVQCTFDGSGPLEPAQYMGIRIYPVPQYPTPVELSAFNANVVEEGVLLTWNTASETDCYEWTVLRDNVSIATLPGHGTTIEPQSYSYLDNVGEGTYTYRLKETDISGAVTFSDPIEVTVSMASEYSLNTNFPNPFNPTTSISYSIADAGKVTIAVYDVSGRMVGTLVDGWKDAGSYEVTFNGTDLASGVYIYKMTAGSFTSTAKMVLMK
ncbi:hypothetical protein CEE37_02740 [candidate division LCP-89 bacterium B3_LCP]|uniref:Fibronectin type-III domain-containing protein n=1 Tax=candidate division LCP-89 bacterium B3_LCP TaxID=2012998 RepID=A0A532V3B6_UNCL8|nr:MAG: hypothetical protein CEE37_02740 [candidate division LCP-89 bacterium B3_LCP]